MKTNIRLLLACMALALLGLASCKSENYENLAPRQVIDTTQQVRYAQVQVILQSNCYNCHSTINAPRAGNGLALDTYDAARTQANSINNRVNRNSGDPLLMPQGGPKLSPTELNTIQLWINQGTQR